MTRTLNTRMIMTAAITGAAMISSAANATLIGDTVTADILIGGGVVDSVTETVLAGPEATGNWLSLMGYNIEESTITVSSLAEAPASTWNPDLSTAFSSLDFIGFPNREIIGVTVLSASGNGFSSITDGDLSWTSDSVAIDMAAIAGTSFRLDQMITIQLLTRDVPSPGAAALLGLAGAASLRRRRH
jgi:MYXO-CTERM domain-containing protein